MIYIVTLLLLIFLTLRIDIVKKKNNYILWYNIVFIILVCIAGFRYRLGQDTTAYLDMFFHKTPKIYELTTDDFMELGVEPLFLLLNSILLTIGTKFYVLQIIQAFFVNGLILLYFRKHSDYMFLCTVLYFIWVYVGFNMEEMRSSISLAICLFANDYIIEKKWLKGYMLYLIASMFHYMSLLMLITPLFLFMRLNRNGILILILTFIVGRSAQILLMDYLILLELVGGVGDKISYYTVNDTYLVQEGNVNYFIVYIIPIIVYPILSIIYKKKFDRNSDLVQFEPFMMFGMICVIMECFIPLFYRLEHFFTVYFILYLSDMFIGILRSGKRLSKPLAITRLIVFFFPFFLYVGMNYTQSYIRYYPYSSVFEMSTNEKRERAFSEKNRPYPNSKEY